MPNPLPWDNRPERRELRCSSHLISSLRNLYWWLGTLDWVMGVFFVRVASLVLLAIVLGVGIPQISVARFDEGGGGGRPCTLYFTLTFYVWPAAGSIYFNGQWYGDGQTASFSGPCGTSYWVSGSFGLSFFQWLSDAGTFGPITPNGCHCQAQFTPTGSGSVTAVMGVPNGLWAGYVLQGTGVTQVTGHFQIPTSASFVDGGTNPQALLIWAGIGGWFGSNLWQAGIQIKCWWILGCFLNPFFENFPDPPQAAGGISPSWGDDISITVTYTPATHVGTYTMTDNTRGGTSNGNFVLPHPPDTTSAEWIAEPGWASGNTNSPSFSTFSITIPTSNLYSSTIFGRLARFTTSNTVNGIAQTVEPSNIVPFSFSVSYHYCVSFGPYYCL